MTVSSEFLLIENGKAIIKTIEKEIENYEWLFELNKRIEQLITDEIIIRLSSKEIGEIIELNEIFSKEINDSHGDMLIKFENKIFINIQQSVLSPELAEEYTKCKNECTPFEQLSNDLQQLLANKFIASALLSIDKTYNNCAQHEKSVFINDKLKEENIAFCRENRALGFHSSGFHHKSLSLVINSNLGYGSFAYDNLNVILDYKYKIFDVRNFNNNSFHLISGKSYTIENARDELNEYLNSPENYKYDFLKNNIRQLKRVLKMEENIIPLIENTIIPDLEKKIKRLSPESKQYEALVSELKEYTEEDNFKKVNLYSTIAHTIQERKIRIENVKNEINTLIDMVLEKDDLLKHV